jgi:glycosyltransferase involved in cell wall biosynthesis
LIDTAELFSNFGDSQLSKIQFSIVIACYNQEDYIREAVASALSQEYPSKEIIVVDDCSSDGTVNVLKTFGASIILLNQPKNQGVDAARNHGASLASGEYLVFLDGDDVLMPWALEVYDRFVSERYPKIILGRAVRFHGKVPDTNTGDIPNTIQFVEYTDFLAKDRPGIYNTSALVVNRSTFWSAGGWSQGIFYQDIQDLLTKLGVSGKTVFLLEPGTVWYRMHSTNAVHKVSLFVEGIYLLLANARSGLYPGGRKRWIERSAWFGGLIFYWTIEAIRTRCYRDGFKLLFSGWWMILLAVIRRGLALVLGRKPIERLQLDQD